LVFPPPSVAPSSPPRVARVVIVTVDDADPTAALRPVVAGPRLVTLTALARVAVRALVRNIVVRAIVCIARAHPRRATSRVALWGAHSFPFATRRRPAIHFIMALVTLSVYDIKHAENAHISSAVTSLNTLTRDALCVGGIFHGGVEIFGDEWSFGYCPEGTGVYRCAPRKNPMYAYRESVPLGVTSLSPARVAACVSALRATWMGTDYDVLGRNCNHFCEALCAALGCEGPPKWLNSFANGANGAMGTVAYAKSGVERACAEAMSGVRGLAEWLSSVATSSASGGGNATESEGGDATEDVVDGPSGATTTGDGAGTGKESS